MYYILILYRYLTRGTVDRQEFMLEIGQRHQWHRIGGKPVGCPDDQIRAQSEGCDEYVRPWSSIRDTLRNPRER